MHQLDRPSELKGERLGSGALAAAGRAPEERRGAATGRVHAALPAAALIVAPQATGDHETRPLERDERAERPEQRRLHDEVVERPGRDQAAVTRVQVRAQQGAAHLLATASNKVVLRDRGMPGLAADRSEEGGKHRVPDVPARHLELGRDLGELDAVGESNALRPRQPPPNLQPLDVIWRGKLEDAADAAEHRLVQVLRPVGGQEAHAVEALNLGEELGHL
mmetsp:Transcript_26465/g.86540  ORF Transcript_26465/g.86540 Transcript_26465/m.86540 type:complete len:221 (-) Transcript_26465:1465-2127(-)